MKTANFCACTIASAVGFVASCVASDVTGHLAQTPAEMFAAYVAALRTEGSKHVLATFVVPEARERIRLPERIDRYEITLTRIIDDNEAARLNHEAGSSFYRAGDRQLTVLESHSGFTYVYYYLLRPSGNSWRIYDYASAPKD